MSSASIVGKDLLLELRRPETLLAAFLLGLGVLLALRLALPADPRATGAAAIWLALFLSGTLVLLRGFAREHEDGTLDLLLLSRASRWGIFTAKAAAAFVSLGLLAAFVTAVGVAMYEIDLGLSGAGLAAALAVGLFALAVLGTYAGALSARARDRQALLPAVLVAIGLFTILLPCVSATLHAFFGETWGALADLRFPAATGLAVLALAAVTIDRVLEE